MKTTLIHTCMHACRIPAAALLSAALLSGCSGVELRDLAPGGSAGNAGNGTPATFSIRLADAPEYNAAQDGTPATRSGEPLLSEWVKVNTFSATRAAGDTEVPKMAFIELSEDTVPAASAAASDAPQTRGVMPTGYTFRVIAFWKNGNQYEFQSVADYTSKGSATPELVRGGMNLSVGQTFRFVAYSFNNNVDMGTPPADYTWGGTPVTIPDLTNDFMTFDSGDKTVTSEAFTLPVSFVQRLCSLTVGIKITGFSNNSFENCTGYVKEGGNQSSWTIGATEIAASTGNTPFYIPANMARPVRLVPFAAARPITVHFSTLTVAGDKKADNTEFTSTLSVKLLPGKSYTMTVQFKRKIDGINVPYGEISGWSCNDGDKTTLSKLLWAKGNLRQQNNNGDFGAPIMAAPTERGHYYTFMSTYTGNTSQNHTDPCSKLDAVKYGANWRTPTKSEMESLSRCTDRAFNGGMKYMNNTKGMFLPAAGMRYDQPGGSGVTPSKEEGAVGYYWTNEPAGGGGHYLVFQNGKSEMYNSYYITQVGCSVRCVQGI